MFTMKSQNIRLVDIFVIGPLMIYAGTQNKSPKWLNSFLIITGAATVAYNYKNYVEISQNV